MKPEVRSLKGFLPGVIDNVYEAVQYPFQNTTLISKNMLMTCVNKWGYEYGTYGCTTALLSFRLRLYASSFHFLEMTRGGQVDI